MTSKTTLVTVFATTALAAGAAFGVDCDGTNVWIGPVTGGSWKNPANWQANSTAGYTVEELFKRYTVYDFSSLVNGAVVTNDYEGGNAYNERDSTGDTFVYGFVFTGNPGDEWTIADGTSASIRFCKPSYIDVTGGTLELQAKIVTSIDYPTASTTKRGNGTFRWGRSDAFFWESTFTVAEGTEVFTNNTSFTTCRHELRSGAKLLVTYGKNRVGSLSTGSTVSADTIAEIADGATLDIATSFNKYVPNFYGDLLGTGTLKVSGGGSFAFHKGNKTGPFSFAGLLRTWNADMTFGTAAAPVGVNPAVSVSIDASGRVNFTDDQSVTYLSGDGTDGGVSVPSDKTLTVTGEPGVSTSLVYAARLTGGAFTKDGTDLKLTLKGANRNTGTTHVKAGTLALKRDFARPGLAAIWSFEDAADMGVERRDVAPLRMTNELTCATEDTLELVPGVVGQAIRFKGGTTTNGTILSTPIATDGKLPAGNEPLTISFWLRPDIAGCGAYPNFLRFWDGNWTGLNGIWFRTPSDTFQSLVMSTEHGWNVKQTNDPSRAVVVDFGSNAYLGDGDWHHVVGTYADQVITLYVDGVSRGSNNLGADMNIPAASQFRVGNFSSTDANHKFAGDIDEIQILHGAWTAEEVAAEYAAKRPAADASLPAPIARWTFDELVDEGGMKLFKDAGPNGWDLVNTPSNGVYVANPAMTYPEDFGGRYAALPATAGPYLRLKSGVTMTDALPQGSSFTVSARVRYPVSGVVLIFGDGTEAGSYRLGYSGCPRNIVAYVGANTCKLYETSMYGIGGSTTDAAWQLVTATYNAQAKIVRTFLDGVPMNEVTGQTVTINPTDLVFGVKTLPVPGPTTYSGFTHASIDELRIYDRALEADEVSRLARTFRYGDGTTVDDQVLSPDSPVVVDAGATLEATDGDHVAMSVSGAGAVNILLTATFAADDWSGFAGTVSGDGALLVRKGQTVPLPIASVTADAGFEDNTVVLDRATAAIPRVRASGRVLLPDTGTLKLADASTPGAWFGKTFVIAECGSYEGPSDTTGWTFDPAAEAGKPIQGEFKVIDGRLLLQTQGGGTAILIR